MSFIGPTSIITTGLALAMSLAPPASPPQEPAPVHPPRALEAEEKPPEPPPFLTPEAICGRGRSLLEDERPELLLQARALYGAGVEEHPDSACVHAGLARAVAAIHLQRIEEDDALIVAALKAARRGVALDADSAEAHASLARALLLDLQPVEADEAARAAVAKDPGSSYALQTAAFVFTMTRQNDDARDAITRALAIAPHLPAAHLTLGNLDLIEGKEYDAIRNFRRAVALLPGYLPALLQLASAIEGVGDYRGAASVMEEVLESHPEASARAQLFMAISLMRRGGWEEAHAILDRVEFRTDRGLGRGTVSWYRGICLEKAGRPEEAEQAYRKVIEDYPDATTVYGGERLIFRCYEALGRMRMEKKDFEGARRIMEEGASRTGTSVDLMVRLARLYTDYNMSDEAMELLERTAERPLQPRAARVHLEAYIAWARLLKRRGETEDRSRLVSSLTRNAPVLERMAQTPIDLDAMRALAIVEAGSEALSWLRRAAERGYAHFGWIEEDADLASLRAAPGYRELVTAAGRRNPPTD